MVRLVARFGFGGGGGAGRQGRRGRRADRVCGIERLGGDVRGWMMGMVIARMFSCTRALSLDPDGDDDDQHRAQV